MEYRAHAFGIRLSTKAFMLLIATMTITPAHAATPFDGQWNVRIAATRAACGDGTMLTLRIADGRIDADGGFGSASGQVSAQGGIKVVLSDGIKRASGFGRLSEQSGSGTWRGPLCSGTWTAQRL